MAGPAGTPPLIGITVGEQKVTTFNGTALRVRSTYPRAVESAGGIPLLIPLQIDVNTLRRIYDRLEGIVITGGGDIDPSYYGTSQSVYTAEVDTHRDEAEIQLARWAVEDDKPLLGICRGHQVMNVALGGTLIQDIRDEIPNSLRHDSPSDEWFTKLPHEISIDPDSKLYRALGVTTERLAVNSMHHQSANQLASNLCLVARADDGVIEGIEHPERRFVIGVQWHPEALFDTYAPHKHLFEAFVKAAQA
jgi:putative glutamine amidotransferase